jgi:hypothetical protein
MINTLYKNPLITPQNIPTIESLLSTNKTDTIDSKYQLFISNTPILNQLFIIFLNYFDYISKPKSHCAIDFEFNNNSIALMQLNFGQHIWIIDPNQFLNNQRDLSIINTKLLLNKKIYKILHGAESLDIPFIFKYLLNNKKKKILIFMSRFIDTRFLCEYVRLSKLQTGKCSIYDGMLYFNTISKSKYDELEKNNKAMGKIQYIKWDINNLKSPTIKYTYYDVLYLIDFLNNIYSTILSDTPELTRTYYYIIQVIRFVILTRQNIIPDFDILKKKVDEFNNYFIINKQNNQTKLSDIYNNIIQNCVISDDDKKVNISFILSVSYIKNPFSYLLKYIVYGVYNETYRLYRSKNNVADINSINLKNLNNSLRENNQLKILKLVNLFQEELINKINLYI